jgi:hypothetical protein
MQGLHLPLPTPVLEELRRDWPILVADENLAHYFSALLNDEELEEVLQEFIAPASPPA